MSRRNPSEASGINEVSAVANSTRKSLRKAEKPARSKLKLALSSLIIVGGLAGAGILSYDPFLSDIPVSIAQDEARESLKAEWAEDAVATAVSGGNLGELAVSGGNLKGEETGESVYSMKNLPKIPATSTGKGYAFIDIPRFDDKEPWTLIEGDMSDWENNNRLLDELGILHYQSREQPGEVGNFAVAAHRNGHGAAFGKIDQLLVGDSIEVEVPEGTFIYSVVQAGTEAEPENNSMLDTNPLGDDANEERKLMTMTTCGWWDETTRVYVVAELTDFKAK